MMRVIAGAVVAMASLFMLSRMHRRAHSPVAPVNTDTADRFSLLWRRPEEHNFLRYHAAHGEYTLCVWSVTGVEWSWAILRPGAEPMYGTETTCGALEAMTRAECALSGLLLGDVSTDEN